jgi:hypothetical protein
MEIKCEYCDKSFSNKGNLNYHKKNNKKCKTIQQDHNNESLLSFCDFCNKTFRDLNTHYNTCKKKTEYEFQKLQTEKDEKDEEIKRLKMRIVELEAENKIYLQDRKVVQKLALQPKTTNNNDNRIKINNNFFNNPEKIKKMIDEKLTKDYICDGQKGVAHFAYNNLIKDENGNMNYICSDPSRHIFKFQNSEGNIEKDVKANKLTNMLIDAGLTNKTLTVAPSLWTADDGNIDSNKFQTFITYTTEISAMQVDNTVFRNELASLTST